MKMTEENDHGAGPSGNGSGPSGDSIESQITKTLSTIFDPEIPVNIYDLGLIYGIEVGSEGAVVIKMTLTSPHCPEAQTLPVMVRDKAAAISGVTDVKVDIVWEPPWEPSKMSEAAKLTLNMM